MGKRIGLGKLAAHVSNDDEHRSISATEGCERWNEHSGEFLPFMVRDKAGFATPICLRTEESRRIECRR
jgi:hypothetical protein